MLTKQVFPIQVNGDMDQLTDSKLVDNSSALLVLNARRDKLGKISKRFGRQLLSNTHDVSDPKVLQVGSVVADDEVIYKFTAYGVYALRRGDEVWTKISDFVSGAKVKSEFIHKGIYNTLGGSCDYEPVSGYFVSVFSERNESYLDPSGKSIVIHLRDQTGLEKIKKISAPTAMQALLQKVLITNDGILRIHLFYTNTFDGIVYDILDVNLEIISSTSIVPSISENIYGKFDAAKDGSKIYFAYLINTSLKLRTYLYDGTASDTADYTVTKSLGKDEPTPLGRLGLSVCLTNSRFHVFYITTGISPTYYKQIVGIGFDKTLLPAIAETVSTAEYQSIIDISIVGNESKIYITSTFSSDSASSPKPCTVEFFETSFSTNYPELTFATRSIPRLCVLARPFIVDSIPFAIVKTWENTQKTGYVINLETGKFTTFFSPFSMENSWISKPDGNGRYASVSNSVFTGDKCYFLAHKEFNISTSSPTDDDFTGNVGAAIFTCDFSLNSSGSRVKVGNTNYFTNGPTIELDARGAHENGFMIHPKISSITKQTTGAANPDMQSKTFSYIAVYGFYNGAGELCRSIPSEPFEITTAANTTYVEVVVEDAVGNNKFDYDSTSLKMNYTPVVELYRRITSENIYHRVANAESGHTGVAVVILDRSGDTEIQDNEILYTTGGILPNDSTPIGEFSAAGNGRVAIGGLEDDEIAYSKKSLTGEVVAFSDFFRLRVPTAGVSDKSKTSAAGFLDDKMIIFKKNSLFFVAGDGPLETGRDNTFSEPQQIPSDVGCDEPRSVLGITQGLMFKKSGKGIYLLNRNLSVEYIGAGVDDYKNEKIIASYLVSDIKEARFLTEAGNLLCFNYLQRKWSVSEAAGAVDADTHNGKEVLAFSNGDITIETTDLFQDKASLYYPLKYITPWLKMNLVQGIQRIWRVHLIGECKSPHTLVLRAYYDYSDTVYDEYERIFDATTPLLQWRIHLKRQVCQAIKFEIFDKDQSGSGESYTLSNLQIEAGIKNGSAKLGASKTN